MSVGVSRAKLLGSVKDLLHRWSRIRDEWDDPAAQHVQDTVLEPLEPRVRAAVTAMEKMGQILMKAKSECE